MTPASWPPGTHITARNIWRGRVFSAYPFVVIEETRELIATYIAPGTIWKHRMLRGRSPLGVALGDLVAGEVLGELDSLEGLHVGGDGVRVVVGDQQPRRGGEL